MVVSRGEKGIQQLGAGDAQHFANATATAVSGRDLRESLTFPRHWGSTEWVRLTSVPTEN